MSPYGITGPQWINGSRAVLGEIQVSFIHWQQSWVAYDIGTLLTHYGLVIYSSLIQIIASDLFGAKPYWNQWWLVVNLIIRINLQWTYTQNTQNLICENAFEKSRLQIGSHFVFTSMCSVSVVLVKHGSIILTHWGLEKMAPYLQTFSNPYSSQSQLFCPVLNVWRVFLLPWWPP